MTLKEECLQDELMIAIYEDIFDKNKMLRYGEVIDMIRYFVIFYMGSMRIRAVSVAEIMNWRLELFIKMLKARGYKCGRRMSHKKEFGFDDILDRAFAMNFEKMWG